MTKKQLTVAVVGFGFWGQKLAGVCAAAGLSVVIVDSVSQQQSAYQQLSWSAVLSDPRIFGVVIATPEKTHATLVLEALAARKAVLVEKPATTTSSSWDLCTELAAKENLPLLVDYTFLHSKALEQWQSLALNYGTKLGVLKKLTSVRRSKLSQQRIEGKAAAIWWDVVIHDLYLIRAVYAAVPFNWQIVSADSLHDLHASAEFNAVAFAAEYSWVSAEPERYWRAEYEHGSILWQRVPNGEAFEVVLQNHRVFSTIVSDQNPSPLDTLIHQWQALWHKKNLSKLQKKHWQTVAEDIRVLTEIDRELSTQVATR